jgi:hypothetical protein
MTPTAELALSYSITSSARTSSDGGTSKSSAFAFATMENAGNTAQPASGFRVPPLSAIVYTVPEFIWGISVGVGYVARNE